MSVVIGWLLKVRNNMAYQRKPDLRLSVLKQYLETVKSFDIDAVADAVKHAQKMMTGHSGMFKRVSVRDIGVLKKPPIESLDDKEIMWLMAGICAKALNAYFFFNFDKRKLCGITFIAFKKDLPIIGLVYDFIGKKTAAAKKRYWKDNKAGFERQAVGRIAEKTQATRTMLNLGFSPMSMTGSSGEIKGVISHLKQLSKIYVSGGYLRTLEFKVQTFCEPQIHQQIMHYKSFYFPMLSRFGSGLKYEKLELKQWRHVLNARLEESTGQSKPVKIKIDFKTKVLNIFNSPKSYEGGYV